MLVDKKTMWEDYKKRREQRSKTSDRIFNEYFYDACRSMRIYKASFKERSDKRHSQKGEV